MLECSCYLLQSNLIHRCKSTCARSMQRHKSRSIERKTISKSIVSRPIEHHLPCLSKKQTSRIVTPISTSARVVNDNIHKATPIMSLKIQNAHKTRLTLIALCLIVASLIALADCMKRTQYHEQVSCELNQIKI